MPSTHSKKRQANDETGTHAGGPLKRTGIQADVWDTHVGGSLDQLPQTQLPQVRTALRLYRSLRTNNPDASKMELARLIANDVILLWQKARVPTAALDKCITRVQAAIDFWSNTSRNPNQRETTLFKEKLDALLDLTPKPNGRGGDKKREEEFLKNLMRSEGKQKNKNA